MQLITALSSLNWFYTEAVDRLVALFCYEIVHRRVTNIIKVDTTSYQQMISKKSARSTIWLYPPSCWSITLNSAQSLFHTIFIEKTKEHPYHLFLLHAFAASYDDVQHSTFLWGWKSWSMTMCSTATWTRIRQGTCFHVDRN
jgi:hypothetical protein